MSGIDKGIKALKQEKTELSKKVGSLERAIKIVDTEAEANREKSKKEKKADEAKIL